MNSIDKTMLQVLAIIALILLIAMQPGPDEVQAAQDVDDDVAAAMQLMADFESCKALRGPDAQVYLLDGQHLVCRAAVSSK